VFTGYQQRHLYITLHAVYSLQKFLFAACAQQFSTGRAQLYFLCICMHHSRMRKLRTVLRYCSKSTRCRHRHYTLKVLCVTFTDTLSASDHVRRVISDSAQSLYALRVLRYHGLGEAGLQTVFRAIVVSRLTYAASAWIRLITGTDNQHIEAFLHRSKRCGYCSPDLPDFVQLVEDEDERLFRRINNNSSHVLRGLLPPPSMMTQQYSLRRRPHDRQMPDHTGHR